MDQGICEYCMGSGESGPDQVCMACDGSGAHNLKVMKDDDGFEVRSGDWISFSYGIPPVRVDARVFVRQGALTAVVVGRHKPREMKLRDLRRHVGNWYKTSGPARATGGLLPTHE